MVVGQACSRRSRAGPWSGRIHGHPDLGVSKSVSKITYPGGRDFRISNQGKTSSRPKSRCSLTVRPSLRAVHKSKCYLQGRKRVTLSGLPSTFAAAASAASAKPGTDSLSRARNSWIALSMISWDVRASVKAIASCSSRLVARSSISDVFGRLRPRRRPRRRAASSGTPPTFPPICGYAEYVEICNVNSSSTIQPAAIEALGGTTVMPLSWSCLARGWSCPRFQFMTRSNAGKRSICLQYQIHGCCAATLT